MSVFKSIHPSEFEQLPVLARLRAACNESASRSPIVKQAQIQLLQAELGETLKSDDELSKLSPTELLAFEVELRDQIRNRPESPEMRFRRNNPWARETLLYDGRVKAARDFYSNLAGAYRKGWLQGQIQSVQEARGDSMTPAADLEGLSNEELLAILVKLITPIQEPRPS